MPYDPLSEIEALRTQQKQKAYSDLEAQKNNSLSQLNQEKSQIQPQYYKSRNTASTNSQLQAKNFAEYMANRSLTSSGTAAQAELTRNVGLQGQIGALNQQENAAYTDINRRTTDVNNNFNTGLTSAYAGVDSDINARIIAYKEQVAQEERQRAYESQQAELEYQRQLALQKQAQAASAARAKSSSSSSSKKVDATQKPVVKQQAIDAYNSLETVTDRQNFLDQYGKEIIEQAGQDTYNSLYKQFVQDYTLTYNVSPTSGKTVIGNRRH